MNKIKNLWQYLSGERGRKLRNSLIVLACGICMLIIVWPGPDTDASDKKSGNNSNSGGSSKTGGTGEAEYTASGTDLPEYYSDAAGYSALLESRLEEILSQVSGVGNVSVMITLQNSGKITVEKDRTTSSSTSNQTNSGETSVSGTTDTSEATVMEDTDSGSSPYVTSVSEPCIEGVVVSCEGGGDPEVALKITEAVQALFDVPAHKIVVLELK